MTKKYEYPHKEIVPNITYDTTFLTAFEAKCIAEFKTEFHIATQPVWSLKSVMYTITKDSIIRTSDITVHANIETFKIVPRHNSIILIPNIDAFNNMLIECKLSSQAINWEAVLDTCIRKAQDQGQSVEKWRKVGVYIFGITEGSKGHALSLCVFPLSCQDQNQLAVTSLEVKEDTVQELSEALSMYPRIEIPILDLQKST